jgi:hypothetical protein
MAAEPAVADDRCGAQTAGNEASTAVRHSSTPLLLATEIAPATIKRRMHTRELWRWLSAADDGSDASQVHLMQHAGTPATSITVNNN